MILQYYGLSFFRAQGNQSDVSVVFDPFDQNSGWRLPRPSADIVLSSDPTVKTSALSVKSRAMPAGRQEGSAPFFITSPGEYEVKGVFAYGINAPKKAGGKRGSDAGCVIYVVGIDDVYVGHLGTLDRSLTEHELDALGRVDVLLLPVGGGASLDPRTAIDVITQVEPRIVVPMMYKLAGVKTDLRGADDFLKEYGVKDVQREDKIKVLKKDLPAQETKVIMLNPI
ncbi:MBL fold metallo-hydrolase [Candidatus Uhrbacteria bacterium]|nr:MBL fold metallo-hydrolase [Candidatus Uhrbacteria bacterium]